MSVRVGRRKWCRRQLAHCRFSPSLMNNIVREISVPRVRHTLSMADMIKNTKTRFQTHSSVPYGYMVCETFQRMYVVRHPQHWVHAVSGYQTHMDIHGQKHSFA